MIRSMTGFAERIIPLSLADDKKTSISISIKSLNSRYFEVSAKLPYQLNSLEIELSKLLKQKLLRGHVYFTIYISDPSVFKTALEPSLSTIEEYLNAIKQIKSNYTITGELTLTDVINLPNVFTAKDQTLDDNAKKTIMNTTTELLQELMLGQQKEGAALLADLEKRIAIMQKEIAIIETATESLVEVQKEKIAQALKDIEGDAAALADIQKHAAYALLDKMDINEEIVRFKSHLKNMETLLSSAQMETGKRLDFTLQEMAREINTIAAKCSDATISSLAINIKVELEKAREQVQNIA